MAKSKFTFRFTEEQRRFIDGRDAARTDTQLLKLAVFQSALITVVLTMLSRSQSNPWGAGRALTTFVLFACLYYLMNAYMRKRARKRMEKK